MRVIHHRNSKRGSAKNTGILAAAGKYICCLEADSQIDPTYIEKCLLRLAIEGYDVCGSWRQDSTTASQPRRTRIREFQNFLDSDGAISGAVFSKELWERIVALEAGSMEGDEQWGFRVRGALPAVPDARYLRPPRSLAEIGRQKIRAVAKRLRGSGLDEDSEFEGLLPDRSRWRNLLNREEGKTGKIRVLVCLPFLTIGGAEKILSEICRGLAREEFHFIVITTKPTHSSQGNSTGWFARATSEIFCLPECISPRSWKEFIAYLILSRHVDILWQAGSAYIYDLLPCLKTLSPEMKVVDILFNEVGHTANNRKYSYLIDLHITESDATKSWLTGHGEAGERIRVIPNGVRLSDRDENKKQPAPFDAGGRTFIVGFFGRLSIEKGPDLFVEIANLLRREDDILFVIGGHGPMENAVREQIARNGLETSVKLLGFCSVESHLPCCDVLVVPSRQDGRPNVVMEAMAIGVPVIGSRVGGMAELVGDGYSGFLCDASNTRQFAEKILLLARDKSLCERLRTGAARHARENFDIRKSVAAFGDTFHELLRPPRDSFADLKERTCA
jgi:glycosyltransferase involved in cell wall biosynthesis